MSHKAKALRLDVYRPSHGDCSNHGVTETHDEVLVLCDEGPVDVDLDAPPANLMCLKAGTTRLGRRTLRLVPATDPDTHMVGPMAGGCYASTSDARWHRLLSAHVGEENAYLAHAVPIHDRYETQAQYEALSR